ncbi:MAG: hypothetical protein LBC18_15925 [Opitutaceae bacterium]|nr:hypothetical protein [Opitutaceae bacterium]
MLSGPQLADVQQIMEERGILHLSDYVRQVIARDIRQWKTEHYNEYVSANQLKSPEFLKFLDWLKQRQTAGSQPPAQSP